MHGAERSARHDGRSQSESERRIGGCSGPTNRETSPGTQAGQQGKSTAETVPPEPPAAIRERRGPR